MVELPDARTLGERIAEARERSGLTQAALASAVSLDRSAVAKIETGSRRVTALELSAIARAVGQRMEWFFKPPIPALVSHRSNQGLDTTDSKVDQLVAYLAGEVEFVQSLDASFVLPTISEPYPRPVSGMNAEELAETARKQLGLESDSVISDLVEVVGRVGLLAFSADLGSDTADAGTILLRSGGITVINSHNKVGKRRLALAHELGHYLMADDYTVDWRVATNEAGIEGLLDRFARALLLPADALRPAWGDLSDREGVRVAALVIASRFRVDMASLARRLEELALAGHPETTQVRATRTTKADIIEHDLYVPTDLQDTSLPLPYQRAVLRLFRDERISAHRALGLLRGTFEEADLPPLRTRREDEIWHYVS